VRFWSPVIRGLLRALLPLRLRNELRGALYRLEQRLLANPFTRQGRLVRKVRARKRALAASSHTYIEAPTMSLVIQSFNHRHNIPRIVEGVRQTEAQELIVCEDGSVDGSDRAWREALDRPNEFVILSNDLHEIRTYNRAISYARGEFVGVMQDDDLPPADPTWVSDAIALLRGYPKLGMVGCWGGWAHAYGDPDRAILTHVGPPMHIPAREAMNPIKFRDPQTKIPFTFVEAVCVGPMFFRRSVFQELGGFDTDLSAPGEAGIWLDYDLCVRAWLAGYEVGYYGALPFARGVGGQGTFMFAPESRIVNFERNRAIVDERYRDRIASVRATIDECNGRLTPRGTMRSDSV
jgi:GT2 family glycosyltransferase